jgi:hypothetical protein
MEKNKIYEGFIEWFRQSGAYVPESVALLPLIQETYTVEEAELLTGMPLALSDIDDLSRTMHMDILALRDKLDELAGRGLVYRIHARGETKYRLNPPRFVFLRSFFWPGRDDDHTRSVAPHVTRYYLDGLGDHWKDVKTKGLRAIPIEKTIDDPRCILPYEAVLRVLQDQDRFAVATCACRHRKNSDPNLPDCRHETENCLHFGKFADYIIENGLGGRSIWRNAKRFWVGPRMPVWFMPPPTGRKMWIPYAIAVNAVASIFKPFMCSNMTAV